MFPVLKNQSELSFPSTTGRSDDLLRGKSNPYFPYLQDLRRLIQKPKLSKTKKPQTQRPESLHVENEKNKKYVKKAESFRDYFEGKFLETPDFKKKLANYRKTTSLHKLKQTLSPQGKQEKRQDAELLFPTLDKLFEQKTEKKLESPKDFQEIWQGEDQKIHLEKFLVAKLNFFSFKEKNLIKKNKQQTKIKLPKVDLKILDKIQMEMAEIEQKRDFVNQIKVNSAREDFPIFCRPQKEPLKIQSFWESNPKKEITIHKNTLDEMEEKKGNLVLILNFNFNFNNQSEISS